MSLLEQLSLEGETIQDDGPATITLKPLFTRPSKAASRDGAKKSKKRRREVAHEVTDELQSVGQKERTVPTLERRRRKGARLRAEAGFHRSRKGK